MGVCIFVVVVCLAVLIPTSLSGMNNPYAYEVMEIRALLKKRFKLRRKLGRFTSLKYMTYEDRFFKMMPFIAERNLKYKYTDTGKRRWHREKRLFS